MATDDNTDDQTEERTSPERRPTGHDAGDRPPRGGGESEESGGTYRNAGRERDTGRTKPGGRADPGTRHQSRDAGRERPEAQRRPDRDAGGRTLDRGTERRSAPDRGDEPRRRTEGRRYESQTGGSRGQTGERPDHRYGSRPPAGGAPGPTEERGGPGRQEPMGSRTEATPPKRTQPLEEPSERPRSERESTGAIEPDVTMEASPDEERAGVEEGESAEQSGPPKYGGPRDRRRRRSTGPERERTQREYERQMDRQFDRQRDFRVGKGGKKSRRR